MKRYIKCASRLPYKSLQRSPYFEDTDFGTFAEDDYLRYEPEDIDRLLKFMKSLDYVNGVERIGCDLEFQTIYVELDARAAQSTESSEYLKYHISERSHDFGIRVYNFNVTEYFGDGLMTFAFSL